METEPFGKILPRMLFPYVQQWAERSQFTLLSHLLVDEQFQGIIDKYGNEILALLASYATGSANSRANGKTSSADGEPRVRDTDAGATDLKSLQQRMLALEAQQEAQRAIFEAVRTKFLPLALAFGCCPDCLVGVEACPKCGGQSRVGCYEPDYALLEAQVVNPLAARGVPLSLNEK